MSIPDEFDDSSVMSELVDELSSPDEPEFPVPEDVVEEVVGVPVRDTEVELELSSSPSVSTSGGTSPKQPQPSMKMNMDARFIEGSPSDAAPRRDLTTSADGERVHNKLGTREGVSASPGLGE